MATLIGIISDTHGLMRPEAVQALKGSERIIHAGDVGRAAIIDQLSRIAPVDAIRGNVDIDEWATALPQTLSLEVESCRIFVIHDRKELSFDPAAQGYACVISGHSHKPSEERRDGVLYLNPGGAGRRRFRLPISVATLTISGRDCLSRIIRLDSLDVPGSEHIE